MRTAILILLGALCCGFSVAHADEAFVKITINDHVNYILSEKSAVKLKLQPADFLSDAKGFWTPSLKEVAQAEYEAQQAIWRGTVSPERVYPRFIRHAATLTVPTLQALKAQAMQIDKNYNSYTRQFIGLVLRDGKKRIYCNYFLNPNNAYDPSHQFVNPTGGGVAFWQVIYDASYKVFDGLVINSSP